MGSWLKYAKFLICIILIAILVGPAIKALQWSLSFVSDISKEQTEDKGPRTKFNPSYTRHDSITITSNADFESLGFPGSGTAGDPYLIENYEIETRMSSPSDESCISIANTNMFFVIQDCLITAEFVTANIDLDNVTNGRVQRNILNNQHHYDWVVYAVRIRSSYSNSIIGNTMSDVTRGENVAVGISSSSNISIIDNTITSIFHGVELVASSNILVIGNSLSTARVYLDSSLNNILSNNTITGYQIGMELVSSSFNRLMFNTIRLCDIGVFMGGSSNTLSDNTISENTGMGVYIDGTSNTISGNTISVNSGYGIYCTSDSEYNLIYLNLIFNNEMGNAYDDGVGNHWNTAYVGNSWSEYNGTGVYQIPGDAGSIDYYPANRRYVEGDILKSVILGVSLIVALLILEKYHRVNTK